MQLDHKTLKHIVDFIESFNKIGQYIEGECNCFSCRVNNLVSKPSNIVSKLLPTIYDKVPYFYNYNDSYILRLGKQFHNTRESILFNLIPILKKIVDNRGYDNYCKVCGDVNVKNLHEKQICLSCVKQHFHTCEVCKDIIDDTFGPRRIILNYRPATVCHNCQISDTLYRCGHCGGYTFRNKMDKLWIGINKYWQITGDQSEIVDYMCGKCGSERSTKPCIICKRSAFLNDGLCGKCFIYNIPVHDYNYKPPVDYFQVAPESESMIKTPLHFGLELEFENYKEKMDRNNASDIIRKIWPEQFLYCVHDGSLNSGRQGLELVTMPFTWKYWSKHEKNWKSVLKSVKQCGFEGDNMPRAGCHIHLDKRAFHSFHLYKFCNFIFDKKMRKFILMASNRYDRDNNEYWSFDPLRYGDVKKLAKEKINKLVQQEYNNRRTAVNVAKHTVELRIFQSTTNFNILSSYMEFCLALYNFTRDTSPKNLNVSSFKTYIFDNKNMYSNFINFFNDRKGK